MLVDEVKDQNVILLHGLSRTSRSMRPMEKSLRKLGYTTHNLNYPSRKYKIEELGRFVRDEIEDKENDSSGKKLHFVTHSMGGILLRHIMKSAPFANLGRVVMLGPPNQGSEIIDRLSPFNLIPLINGPACFQLGTSSDGFIKRLGPVEFELGVIAGNRSINPFLSFLIPGVDDGRVSVERTKIEGMNDFCEVPKSHSFLIGNKQVQDQTISFLQKGKFSKKE